MSAAPAQLWGSLPQLAGTALLGCSAVFSLTLIFFEPLRKRLWPEGERPEPPPLPAAGLAVLLYLQLAVLASAGMWRSPFRNLGGWQLPIQAVASQLLIAASAAAAMLAGRVRPSRMAERLGLADLRPSRLASGALTWLAFMWVAWLTGVVWVWLLQAFGRGDLAPQEIARQLLATTAGPRVVTALLVVTVAPLCEEAFFRGVIFAALRPRLGFWAPALGSAAFFAAVHGSILYFAPLLLLGLLLAWLYDRTGSLWPCVALHAVQNAFAIIGLLWGQTPR